MGEPQSGEITVLGGKVGEAGDENAERMDEISEALAHKDQVGVTSGRIYD